MGQFNSANNSQIVQTFTGPVHGMWGTPALWHNNLYVGGRRDSVRQFIYNPTTVQFNSTVASQSWAYSVFPERPLPVSASTSNHGIVWAIDSSLYGYASPNAGQWQYCSTIPLPAACSGPAILHAYNAKNLATDTGTARVGQ